MYVSIYMYITNRTLFSKIFPFLYTQWLQEEFLSYLDEWEQSVRQRDGFSASEKNKMQLSPETILGLRLTGV